MKELANWANLIQFDLGWYDIELPDETKAGAQLPCS